MRRYRRGLRAAGVFAAALFVVSAARAQQERAELRMPAVLADAVAPDAVVPDAPAPAGAATAAMTSQTAPAKSTPANDPENANDPQDGQQSKRILGIIPNFRAVSAEARLPALSKSEKLKLSVSDSFDYSSFVYVAMLAGADQLENSTPEFHQGAKGYARYYWHSFADNTDGNLMTEAIFPILTNEDPRYYTKGHGGFVYRLGYSVGRLIVTRTDEGGRTFNVSEIAGNGVAAAISDLYYPAPERTFGKTVGKWGLQIGLDGASNVLKEFWPDIAQALSRKHGATVQP